MVVAVVSVFLSEGCVCVISHAKMMARSDSGRAAQDARLQEALLINCALIGHIVEEEARVDDSFLSSLLSLIYASPI